MMKKLLFAQLLSGAICLFVVTASLLRFQARFETHVIMNIFFIGAILFAATAGIFLTVCQEANDSPSIHRYSLAAAGALMSVAIAFLLFFSKLIFSVPWYPESDLALIIVPIGFTAFFGRALFVAGAKYAFKNRFDEESVWAYCTLQILINSLFLLIISNFLFGEQP